MTQCKNKSVNGYVLNAKESWMKWTWVDTFFISDYPLVEFSFAECLTQFSPKLLIKLFFFYIQMRICCAIETFHANSFEFVLTIIVLTAFRCVEHIIFGSFYRKLNKIHVIVRALIWDFQFFFYSYNFWVFIKRSICGA